MSSPNIVVTKQGVNHTFVAFDEATDHFTRNVFAGWENDTFEVFETVKDPEGIAVDLGAWIGVTAIWLSKHFHHVVAIDADKVSIECLKLNLQASECPNVSICPQPITHTTKEVTFGPRPGWRGTLNESTSYVKDKENASEFDFTVKSLTFKQLIHDYILKKPELGNRHISFIKCDIEGGEEDILEDILYFAYHNKTKVHLSFHLSWWKSKSITDFVHLFSFFKTNCPTDNIYEYVRQNPFTSILFEPLDEGRVMIKKDMPVVVMGYNQCSYLKNMVSQLEKYTSDIIVVDNCSTYPALLEYYDTEFKYTLLRQEANHGFRVYTQDFVQRLLGDVYILTDPDLQFNTRLPDNFIQVFTKLMFQHSAERVGFALSIDSDDIREDIFFRGQNIKQWESRFWSTKIPHSTLELYEAEIDTTFCMINRKSSSGLSIRVAGDYTCQHLPWYKGYKDNLMPGELEAYKNGNNSSAWGRQ